MTPETEAKNAEPKDPAAQAARAKGTEGYSAEALTIQAAGAPALRLRAPGSPETPSLVEAELLPGRGMNIYQLRATHPRLGVVEMLGSTPPLEEGARRLSARDDSVEGDFNGNESFRLGGAILAPFANRIRGRHLADRRLIEVEVPQGRLLRLPANWKGREPGAEPHAMHGLVLKAPFEVKELSSGQGFSRARARLDAGDFGGHWPSRTELEVRAALEGGKFHLRVEARNTGSETSPIGIGWHPYFALPSGRREQAILKVPARSRTPVDGYDNVFPTGEVQRLEKVAWGFGRAGGQALGKLHLDDCFVDVVRDGHGRATAEIIDPAARYGVRIVCLSPEIQAFQVYAPVDKPFIALEPQFNWGDPFSAAAWKGLLPRTGMVSLEPGASVSYEVDVELFVP